ncbi:MAG: hypothetical protein O2944_09235, partial [Proteobacteria bacterium]|nr:hypothetical protein [Pseudomonadota bacterium]
MAKKKTTRPARKRAQPTPVDASKQALAEALPGALDRALKNYRALADAQVPDDAKAFQQHQTACKAALAHVDALIKLAAAVDDAGRDRQGGADIGPLIERAEAAFKSYAA